MGTFSTASDPTLDGFKVQQIASVYGYSTFEVQNFTMQLRQSMLNAIAEDILAGETPSTIVSPEQAVTAADVSFFSNFVEQVKARTGTMLKFGIPIGIGAIAIVVGILALRR